MPSWCASDNGVICVATPYHFCSDRVICVATPELSWNILGKSWDILRSLKGERGNSQDFPRAQPSVNSVRKDASPHDTALRFFVAILPSASCGTGRVQVRKEADKQTKELKILRTQF